MSFFSVVEMHRENAFFLYKFLDLSLPFLKITIT